MNKIKIYQKAIELLQNAPSDYWLGLCNVITETILLEEHGMNCLEAQDKDPDTFYHVYELVSDCVKGFNNSFIEIARHKPEIIYGSDYWFDPNDRTSRIEILNKAIVELQENGYKADQVIDF